MRAPISAGTFTGDAFALFAGICPASPGCHLHAPREERAASLARHRCGHSTCWPPSLRVLTIFITKWTNHPTRWASRVRAASPRGAFGPNLEMVWQPIGLVCSMPAAPGHQPRPLLTSYLAAHVVCEVTGLSSSQRLASRRNERHPCWS
jgi:hypothetical protein